MKAVQIIGPGRSNTVETPFPDAHPGEILVQVMACGLCTTDSEILSGHFWGTYPIVPGHEISGVVHSTSDDVTHLHEGDRVAIDPNIPCGYCHACRGGAVHLCDNLKAIGVTRDGGFAEYVAAPARNAYPLPKEVGDVEGALAEPLACILHGIDRTSLRSNDVVSIHGGGFIGLLFSVILRHHGISQILVVDPSPRKRTIAEQKGLYSVSPDEVPVAFRQSGMPPSLAIVCSGNPNAFQSALMHVAPGGRVLLFGVAKPTDLVEVAPYHIFARRYRFSVRS